MSLGYTNVSNIKMDSFSFLTPHSSASFLPGLLKHGWGRNGRPSLETRSHLTLHQPEGKTLSSWTKRDSNRTGPLLPSQGLGWTSTTGSASPGHSMSWASDQQLVDTTKHKKLESGGKKVTGWIIVLFHESHLKMLFQHVFNFEILKYFK